MSEEREGALLDRGLRAVWQLARDQEDRDRLAASDAAFDEFLEKFQLPERAKAPLRQIVERLNYAARDQLAGEPLPLTPAPSAARDVPRADDDEISDMLLESFVHIRWSFWVSMVMSVVLFLVGMVFMSASLARALGEGSVSSATLTIAGLGIADFVLLFYTRPWRDVAANLSNSQQVRIIATSYLAALSLLQQGKAKELRALERVAEHSVSLLEQYTEGANGEVEGMHGNTERE